MEISKEEIQEWNQDPTTKKFKNMMVSKVSDLNNIPEMVAGKNREEMVMDIMRRAGQIEGIEGVIYYEGD